MRIHIKGDANGFRISRRGCERFSRLRMESREVDAVNEWRIDYLNVLKKFRISRMTSASFDKKTW
jgi:hypothetical protein